MKSQSVLWIIILSLSLILSFVFSSILKKRDSDIIYEGIIHSKRIMVCLTLDQSNAANFYENNHVCTENVYYLHDGRFRKAQDPLPSANGKKGTVWIQLADRLIKENLYDCAVLYSIAQGSSTVKDWLEGRRCYPFLKNAIDDLSAFNIEPTHIVYCQ